MFHIGVVIRTLRDERGWSGERLAEEARVSPTTISTIENGASFRRPTLKKIALALGVTEADLYAWEKTQSGRIRTALVAQLDSHKDVAAPSEQQYSSAPSPVRDSTDEGESKMADDPDREELLHCYSLLTANARLELLRHARTLTASALTERNRGGAIAHQRKKATRS